MHVNATKHVSVEVVNAKMLVAVNKPVDKFILIIIIILLLFSFSFNHFNKVFNQIVK
jgi:hypothetical protein